LLIWFEYFSKDFLIQSKLYFFDLINKSFKKNFSYFRLLS
jgi:hypothetical protein